MLRLLFLLRRSRISLGDWIEGCPAPPAQHSNTQPSTAFDRDDGDDFLFLIRHRSAGLRWLQRDVLNSLWTNRKLTHLSHDCLSSG